MQGVGQFGIGIVMNHAARNWECQRPCRREFLGDNDDSSSGDVSKSAPRWAKY